MHAGLIAEPTPSAGTPEGVPSNSRFDADARSSALASRGGVVWITGVAGVARAGLVDIVRRQLEPSWGVDVITPGALDDWLHRSDVTRAAIVVSSGEPASAAASARPRAEAAELVFVEVRAVSDWDALVEGADSTILGRVADFFAQFRHGPRLQAPHNRLRRVGSLSDPTKQHSLAVRKANRGSGLAEARSAEAEGAPYTTRRRLRRAPRPDAVIRLDWHSPSQIERRIVDALHRGGLIERSRL